VYVHIHILHELLDLNLKYHLELIGGFCHMIH
jgi:hypothetical protein